MNEILELINEYYPLSDEAIEIIEQSLKSFDSNEDSVDFEKVPVFLSKLLNRLEAGGTKINYNKSNENAILYEHSYTCTECFGNPYISEEELMSNVIDDLVGLYKGKTLNLFNITFSINKEKHTISTYLIGIINE